MIPMRKPIIAGNWKMNKTPAEAKALVSELKPLVKDANATVVVCVPAIDVYAVKAGLIPIICVGERKEEREAGYTDALVEYQTLIALNGLTDEQVRGIVVAYEPVWAIGTGLTATDEQANETIGVIRKAIARKYGAETGDAVRIQYGGSMNPKNVKGLMAQPEIDGGLIGGASLKAPDFSLVVNYDK